MKQINSVHLFDNVANSNKLPKVFNTPTMSYRCLNNPVWGMIDINGLCNEIMDCSPTIFTTHVISLGQLINDKDEKLVWESVQAALKNRAPYQLIYHIKTPLDNEKIIFEQGQGLFLNDELVELYGFISDITPSTSLIQCDDIQNLIYTLTEELIQLTQKTMSNKIEYKLSIREVETLICTCKGMTMKEIGIQLKLSPRTVEMHLNRIKAKLQCLTKTELKALFFKTNIGKKIIAMV